MSSVNKIVFQAITIAVSSILTVRSTIVVLYETKTCLVNRNTNINWKDVRYLLYNTSCQSFLKT